MENENPNNDVVFNDTLCYIPGMNLVCPDRFDLSTLAWLYLAVFYFYFGIYSKYNLSAVFFVLSYAC